MSYLEQMTESTAAALVKEFSDAPPVLYKYCSVANAEKILRSGGVRLSPRADFNDPFDMMCRVEPPSEPVLNAFIAQYPESERGAVLQGARRGGAMFRDKIPPETAKFIERVGVSCFSSVRDSILMWGHYADGHKGMCIGFRKGEPPMGSGGVMGCLIPTSLETGNLRLLRRVSYSNDFPVWKPMVAELKDNIMNVFSKKALCWAYEEEWRIIAMDSARTIQPLHKDAFGYVIFGAKTSEEDKDRIVRAAIAAGHAPEFRQAKIMRDKYQLEICPWRCANNG